MAVALLASRGYEVVASTGKVAEAAYLTGLGAAEVVDRADLLGPSDRVLGPERWAGAVDCVGGPTLSSVLRTLRYGAAVAASGLTGGTALETSVYPFIVRDVTLIGVDTVLTPIDERRRVWGEMATAFAPALLDDMVREEVGLGDLAPVLERIHGRRGQGPDAGAPRATRPVSGAGPQVEGGAVVWLLAPVARNTGETTRVPPPQGASAASMTRWSKALGGVTWADAEVGHVVSVPTGTSEYPMLKTADWPGASVTVVGAIDVKL